MKTDTISIQEVYNRLTITPEQLKEFCIRWQIAELAVFGSILRDDFRLNDEIPSDIDLLFSDQENARKNLILQVKMMFELEEMLHRKVDLISKKAVLDDPNAIRRQHILESAKVIYVEG
ncbi:MAG: nucleotidyltransferase family protein [Limnothrix sp. BL-A-16]|jgi:hypothetical protein